MVKYVIKKDGKREEFETSKIIVAISNANRETEDKVSTEDMYSIIDTVSKFNSDVITTDEINNIIEEELIKYNKLDLVKKYIIFNEDSIIKINTTDNSILSLINCKNIDTMEENSNKKATLISTQRDLIAGECSKDITDRLLLPEKIVKAHRDGILHFHDKDYFLQPMFNCCLVNLGDMLDNGTVINGKLIESPKSFQVACIVTTQIIASISGGQYGGQSIDIKHLAKYLRVTYDKHYKKRYDINIQNPNQPLILVIREGPQEQKVKLYFVPELCHLAGLDDDFLKDREFMKKLAEFTKLKPADRIRKTNEFLSLLMEEKKQGNNLSAKEKSIKYGIEVTPLDQKHKAYIMKETVLLGHKNTIIPSKGQFDVLSKKPMTKWICLYRKSNYNDADKLYKTLNKASRGYNLAIAEPEWVEMGDRDNAKIWVDTANDYMKGNQYQFAVFLLDKNDRIYTPIKKASLCTCGYISQVVKVSSLGRNEMSVCSKIILQINAKLSGVSYMAKLDNNVKERKLMIIGVDSSHIKGKRTGVAMVSTINTSFTNFYNKEQIFTEEKNEQFLFCVGGFIKEAIAQYSKFNDGKLPGGIIIYRQGVSLQQKEFLTNEVKNIQAACDEHKILYEYILVNTKTTYKFFETKKNGFENPQPGLLVLNGVTSRNFFEFYIQPQQVTGGSATPSCYTVAYGNLGFPEIIPKLTFDLCHLYSNWQGPVRVPHVLKSAEKLSKMTAKYTQDEMNDNLSKGQAYL